MAIPDFRDDGRFVTAVEDPADVDAVKSGAESLAAALLDDGPLPPNAATDALPISIAATNGIEYLLTWNCRHIANPALRPRIESICRRMGYEPPVICTPQELLEIDDGF